MKSIYIFILIASVLVNSSVRANETESNDAPSLANTLKLNGKNSGAISEEGDADWWKVTTTADGKLSLTLKNTGSGILNLSLYDTAGTVLLNGPQQVKGNQLTAMATDGLGAGTFFILIKGKGLADIASYTISDSLLSPRQTAENEPNDTLLLARKINKNTTKTAHIGYYYNNVRDSADWFKLTTILDGLIKITFKTINKDTIACTFFDRNGKTVLDSAVASDELNPTFKVDGLAGGIYYIRITSAKGFTPYIITDSIFTYNKYTVDREPNKYPYQSNTLNANGIATGHISFYNNTKVDSTDYFKLNYTGTGDLAFKVNLLPAISDSIVRGIRFDIFKDTLAPPISADTFLQQSNTLSFTSLTRGIYYIRVRGLKQSLGGASAYSITDSFGVLLPVTFISLGGRVNNAVANLNWSTASEINNKGFEVQKSMDGEAFSPVGFVQGAGTSSIAHKYSFSDPKLLSGTNYYRLKQIDFDGKFIYSSAIKLDYSKFKWVISGNPVTNSSWLQLQLDKSSNVSIQIISIKGNVMQTINKGNLVEGTYSVPLNLQKEAAGMYVIKLIIDNKAYSKVVTK